VPRYNRTRPPRGHGCKTLEGLGKGALAVLSNLMMKTNADSAEFMIANEKDGEFHFTAKWIKHKDLGKVSETDFVNIAAAQTTEKPNDET